MAADPRPDPARVDVPESARPEEGALLEGAWAGLARDLAAEGAVLGALRRRSFTVRAALALGLACAAPVLALALAPRWDADSLAWPHVIALGLLGAALALVSARLAAQPLQARSMSPKAVAALAVSACGLGLALAVAPLGVDAAGEPPGHTVWRCGASSLAVGALVFGAAHALGRAASGAIVGASALGGVAALASLAVLCSVDEGMHLLLGHAAPVVLVVGFGLAQYVRPSAGGSPR